ncbi:phage head morphogenesis protein [Xanthobacter autotrophicus]|uniref:phage head morphogenesis protein n=1 Tax=Xanthobacter autotrophicus TaxID=280 RepID=UPI00372798A6
MRRRGFLRLLLATLAGIVRKGMDAPPEVLDYFRRKELAPRFSWRDVWGEEHAHAFTVAGVTEAKVLAEFRAGIDRAIAEGKGFEAFQKEMQKRLSPLGWWGPRDVADDVTGKVKSVDFSQARRLETTFWSNMRAARAAGQWDRAQRTKSALPFLLYVRTASAHPRDTHLRFVGIILPVDDLTWRWMFPPNGWGCKCAVRQISGSQRDRYLEGTKGEDGVWYTDVAPPRNDKPYLNKRTGETTMVPAGIDPGWHTNPGIGRAKTLGQQLVDRLVEQEPAVARTMTRRFVRSDGFESFVWRAHRREEAWQKVPAAERRKWPVLQEHWDMAPMPVATLPVEIAEAAGTSAVITATDYAVAHNASHAMAAFEWARVQRLIDVGEVRRRERDGSLQVIVPRSVNGKSWWYVILHPDRKGWRIGTQMRASPGYVSKEREAGVLVRAGTGDVVEEGPGEVVAEERP